MGGNPVDLRKVNGKHRAILGDPNDFLGVDIAD